jgi:hypothetical protein
MVAALPGIVLLLVSGVLLILLFLVSILALLLLTVPVYRVLRALGGGDAVRRTEAGGPKGEEVFVQTVEPTETGPQTRRPIEVKILE